MMIADTHLLGEARGHWFDKLRREWQMRRAFQTSTQLFRPDVAFILGDVFDEGDIANDPQFVKYLARFHDMFAGETPVYSIVGNHDIGFHYK